MRSSAPRTAPRRRIVLQPTEGGHTNPYLRHEERAEEREEVETVEETEEITYPMLPEPAYVSAAVPGEAFHKPPEEAAETPIEAFQANPHQDAPQEETEDEDVAVPADVTEVTEAEETAEVANDTVADPRHLEVFYGERDETQESSEEAEEAAITSPLPSGAPEEQAPGPFDLRVVSPEPQADDIWRLVALTHHGLIPASMEPAVARTSWEETPPEFLHLFAMFEQQTQGKKILGITSALAGEGKTTVALHLALATARSSFRRVCLLDLSMGEDDLCRRIGAAPAPSGIVACLEQNHLLALLERSVPGGEVLTVIPAGSVPRNPARLARSPRITSLLAALRDACDLVIVDLPSVASDNAIPIAAQMDGLILVAQAGVTPRGNIEQAADLLGRDRITGVVLNRTPEKKRRKR